jgi:hypothetical protein
MGEQMVTMKSEVVGRPCLVSDDLVQSVDQKICESRRFTISELSSEFPQISCIVLYEIIIVRIGHHNFCAGFVPKMLMGAHKTQRMASALSFFTAIPHRWRWISQSLNTNNRWRKSRPALGPIQPPVKWVPGTLSPGLKRQGREADHLPPTSAEVKKIWICTSTLTPSWRSP